MNRAGLDMIEADSFDMVKGCCVYPLVSEEYREAFKAMAQAIFKGESRTFEFKMTGLKGRQLWLYSHAVPIRNEKGEIIFALATTIDITQRKRMEEALRESVAQYRGIFDSAGDAFLVLDLQGRIVEVNSAACSMFGYSRQTFLGLTCLDIVARGFHMLIKEFLQDDSSGVPSEYLELRCLRTGGSEFFAELRGASIPFNSQPHRMAIVRDITELKKAEELRRDKFRAEAASSAKSDFLARMSHEIRTPMNGIIGMAEICMETRMDENQQFLLQSILSEANILLSLVNDVLDFSKIEAGRLEIEAIPFDLRHLVDELIGSLTFRARQKKLRLAVHFPPAVPARLVGDPVRLRQILMNLASNAVKFTHKGTITINAELAVDLGDRVQLCFSVEDTGIGIPAAKQAAIFESFTQADGSTTRKYGGTGLGTTIAKQLTELMGGRIELQSEEGKGSTFKVHLSLARQQPRQAASQPEASDELAAMAPAVPLPAGLTTGEKRRDGSDRIRILLVEDYPTNQQVAMRHLRKEGLSIDLAENGRQAVEAFSANSYHLILMDIEMPEMDGYMATRAIRALEAAPVLTAGEEGAGPRQRVPIVAMTAHALKGVREKCLEAGMDDYITKPLKRKELIATVAKWLPRPSLARSEAEPDQDDTAPVASGPPMDLERAVAEFEGDREFLISVVDGFIANGEVQLAAISQAIEGADGEGLRREAHAIKGGAANLTASALREAAWAMEQMGGSGNLEGAEGLLAQLAGEFSRLKTFRQGW